MIYENIEFPELGSRCFFYSNFVSTLDGKVKIYKPGYWPIGTRNDYEGMLELRSFADVLIHGKKTVGGTLKVITTDSFYQRREKLGKKPLLYLVITSNPDESLVKELKDNRGIKHILATTDEAVVSKELEDIVQVVRLGEKRVDIKKLADYLFESGYKNILVEGGPNVMGEFFKEDLIDEIFLTIAPKIYGSDIENTLTMVEGYLLPPDKTINAKILSVKQVEDELFLRYTVKR